ncbi:DUF2807 domain-containing protein [Myxococcus sp. CA051A]|uniref:head GIN domain-containing protein n=1 Tax=Myxococcus sp. CA051A TaxID=2741739 RepID=UPI00157AA594|nr:head GIN domain-containing protein [Myxococcus sp. CA051A]NTX63301.1 DUF2807 domain-containing protein [Myxococcus sp. CA051A]
MKTARMSLLVPLLMFAGTSFAEGSQKGEARDVPDFESLAVGHGIKAQVKVGPKSVRVEGPSELLSRLRLVVKDGQLTTQVERDGLFSQFQGGKVRLYVSNPHLDGVDVSGGGNVEAEVSPSGDEFSAEASGGAALTVRGVDTKKVEVEASGGAAVNLAGRAQELDIEASGGAVIKAMDLKGVKSLEVEASGGVHVEADPSESLSVNATGGTTVQCVSRPPRTEVKARGGTRVVYLKD